MSYVPTNWATGDVITAEKLNNIENGIVDSGKAVFVITVVTLNSNQHSFTFDKTFTEIKTAFASGKHLILRYSPTGSQTEAQYNYYTMDSAVVTREAGVLTSVNFSAVRANFAGGADTIQETWTISGDSSGYYNILTI